MPAATARRVRSPRGPGVSIGDAVVVTRPGRWGNPFVVDRVTTKKFPEPFRGITVVNSGHAVALYRALVRQSPRYVAEARFCLTGRRLACLCAVGAACHGDVLLAAVVETFPLSVFRWDLSAEVQRWDLPVPARLPTRQAYELLDVCTEWSQRLDRSVAEPVQPTLGTTRRRGGPAAAV